MQVSVIKTLQIFTLSLQLIYRYKEDNTYRKTLKSEGLKKADMINATFHYAYSSSK